MLNRRTLALLSAAALLAGCGGTDGTTAVLSTAEPETVTATVTVTDSATTGGSSTTTSATSDDDETETETTAATTNALPPEDRPLGLDDFFNPTSDWEEGRWNVANRTNEQGVAVLLRSTEELELRLQNQYQLLHFDAGQANDSLSSECLTKVDIVVDGELRETREFAFNTIQEFTNIDVRDSNAVKIELSRGRCDNYVQLVLSRIRVE